MKPFLRFSSLTISCFCIRQLTRISRHITDSYDNTQQNINYGLRSLNVDTRNKLDTPKYRIALRSSDLITKVL